MLEQVKMCRKCGGDTFILHGRDRPSEGHPEGKRRHECVICGHRTVNPYTTQPELSHLDRFVGSWDSEAPRHIITAAQNATDVDLNFLKALQVYTQEMEASFCVIPFKYRNSSTNLTEPDQGDDWWDGPIADNLYSGRQNVGSHLTVLGDIPVTPTAVVPLSGLDSITGDRSGIVGHPKLELKAIPMPQHKLPKIMATTGAITLQNYTDSKSGKKGEFHHTMGAAVVEQDGEQFHLRQINALLDGSFIDLDKRYTPKGVESVGGVEALVLGDLHVDYLDPDVVAATITNKDSMINLLKPKYVVLHDVIDFYSRGHHTRFDPFVGVAKQKDHMDDVFEEVARACKWVDMLPKDIRVVMVPSNHHDHMYRWMKETDWRFDPVNAEMYLETALHMVRSAKMGTGGAEVADPFLFWAERLITTKDRCVFLKRDESFTLKGIELSMHGDIGANGARASKPGMARMGVKSILGHTHTPAIFEGAYWAGCMSVLRRDFNPGPSSWMNSNVVIYSNGKRSILNVLGQGRWRLA